ncbi:MAG: hypothetical protein AAFY28_13905 [Actinomycetota bacterium]
MDGTIRIRSVMWFATAVALGVISTLLISAAWSADAAPGDEDATFVPTAGCRVTDTRPPPQNVGPRSTPLGEGDTFTVAIHGDNGECTGPLAIPPDAVGVALNVTATNATTSSNIRVFPANLTEVPLLSNLNVAAGAPPTPNKVDVQLSPAGAIAVYNFKGSVDIVIDIVGYYTSASLTELASDVARLEPMWVVKSTNAPDVAGRVSSPEFGFTRDFAGSYRVDFGDINVGTCSWSATLGTTTGLPDAARVLTALDITDPTRVVVFTTDNGGVSVDSGWQLQLFC